MFYKQYKRLVQTFAVLSFIFVFVFTAVHSIQAQPSKDFVPKSDLKLLITDQKTGKRLAGKTVRIYSDNGVRCIKAPCPTNGKNWTSKSDRRGYIIIPDDIRQNSMSLIINGYNGEELNRSARRLNKNSWVIALKTE